MSGEIKGKRERSGIIVQVYKGSLYKGQPVVMSDEDDKARSIFLYDSSGNSLLTPFTLDSAAAAELAHQLLNDPESEWDDE